jgi:predicted phage tail protein
VESPNTLQSKAVYRGIDLLCEGEIEGLVDGHKSIFLQDVPLQAAEGGYNFGGVKVWTRTGMPGQSPVEGFPEVETPRAVGVELTKADGAVVRSVTDANADAVYILVTVPALYEQRDNGDMVGSSVSFAIRINDGQPMAKTITGKCTSPYQENYRIALPPGQSPWNIRLARITPDSESQKQQNKIVWTSYTEIIDHKMEYPDSAYVAAEIDAELFGSRVPKRSYRIRGLKVATPEGYTPPRKDVDGAWLAAVYPPTWDGTWQSPQYTSNPAWCFYALLTSHRFGAGLPAPDKWALYPIARYCDELVPDGVGGMEPRFTLNAAITSQHEAFQLINLLASCFRGMCWWGPGTITASQDAPTDPQILACPANVRNGLFTYEGSALSARHTVALVTWNDPANHCKPVIEAVEDSEAIARFGYRPAEVAAFGCTSRGMANRVGRWLLDSERNETELVSYQAGLDHAFVRPGMIVEVADPFYANVRMGGRLKAATASAVELDAPVILAMDETYSLTCVLGESDADGCPVVEQRGVITVSDGLEHASLAVSPPFSGAPQAGAVWIITGSDIAPRRFRVLSKVEADGYYTITALFHDHTKYARIEQGIYLEQPAYATPIRTGQVLPPGGCDLAPATYYTPSGLKNLLRFSWQASIDERVGGYRVQHRHEGGNWTTVEAPSAFMAEVRDVQVGLHEFRVQALSRDGGESVWIEDFLSVEDPAMLGAGLETVNSAGVAETWPRLPS